MPSSLLLGTRRSVFLGPDGRPTWAWLKWFDGTDAALAKAFTFRTGLHAERKTAGADGSLYYETDRQLLYIAVSGQWFYRDGIYFIEQEKLPEDLTVNDVNFLAYVSDYAHLLRWDGTAWSWAPGELGSGFMLDFLSAPDPVTGWVLCDGSTDVPQLLADGTLTFSGPLPTTAGRYFRQ